ncbi:site-specific integrase [Thalassomonas actiniarum]|uniref:Site-specific integrase n=1 Tax=Thalassomonas actiniarum TaxID=485447 RepID=A0AAE9YWL7_9GAMM|nr:site-specific integrase [Thalassomonas actiniarum]
MDDHGWLDTPQSIITREGKEVDSSSERWHLPYSIWKSTSLDFNKIINLKIRWSVKSYVRDRLERSSVHAGYSVFQHVYTEFLRYAADFDIQHGKQFKEQLISLIESRISVTRKEHRLWALYRPIQWYIYCAENYPELGFCPAYAMELEGMSIPGNPKGEAVRMEDPDKGPLHHSLELPLLIAAMKNDTSKELKHLQEKVAVALSIAFGRNPANLTYLREEDFIDLTPEAEERCYILKIPRIKKKQLSPRDDFLDEYLAPLYANYIIELIDKNAAINTELQFNNRVIPNPKPLFINQNGNRAALLSSDFENAYNVTSADITGLLKSFVARHNLISPVTKSLLQVNTRRLRYTLATGLAAEGISKKELARILDHTDTQHVLVYFEMAGKVVEHLDKAAAKGLSRYLQFFKGKVIDSDDEAVNGERADKHISYIDEENPTDQENIGVCGESSICHLDPPYSCYLCPKFQPYRHAGHEHVLECLLQNREKRLEKYENARLGIQLDEVIAAVAQVTELCAEGNNNG